MNLPRLHRRQFVLGPEPSLAGAGWVSEEISPSLYLSHCPELPLASVTDKRGIPWRLLGTAVQSDPDAPEPLEQLADNEDTELLDVYGSWVGRWLLISDSELHLDACGLLGCFYRTIHDGSTAELWASSSPALIAALPGRERLERRAPRIHWGKGMEWYPPPESGVAGVSRLLPTQILLLAAGADRRVLARPPLVDVQQPSYEQTLDALQRNLVTSLCRLEARGEPMWLPLTSGFDSRLILAATKQADLPLETFTQEYPLMSTGDRRYPPLLARELGYSHTFIRPARFSRRREELFDAHCARHCVEVDRRFFAHKQWEAIPAPAQILRGAVFWAYTMNRKFPNPVVGDLFQAISKRFRFDEFHRGSCSHFEGIAEWVDWVARTPHPGLDWRDRLFLEQSNAGWVSSIEQALDLTAYERFYVANSHVYVSTTLALSEETRRSRRHHVDLIRRMAPELQRFPFNPPDDALVRLSVRVRDEWHELSARSRKAGYPVYVANRVIGAAKRLVNRRG
ncbi:MAG: hypothetical protein M3P12_01230 [Gemmatimonadota bacterium]|nr:hypothetical protein [Gemmatimonadota bacterium]